MENRPRQPPLAGAGEADFDHPGHRIVIVKHEAADQAVIPRHADRGAGAEILALAAFNEPGHELGNGFIVAKHRPHTATPPDS